MAKFSITQLEDVRIDPVAFAKQLAKEDGKIQKGGNSKYGDWQNAAITYHLSDENSAVKYLIDSFNRHFVHSMENQKQLDEMVTKLQHYIIQCKNEGLTLSNKRKNIRYELNNKIQMTGRIPLIFENKNDNYSVYYFGKSDNLTWENELKYPFTQFYVANVLYECGFQSIEVGYYSFESERYFKRRYSVRQLQEAIDEIGELGKRMAKYL